MRDIFNFQTGDARAIRRQANTLYGSLREYLKKGEISSNPFLARELDGMDLEARSAYVNNAVDFLNKAHGYEREGRILGAIARNSERVGGSIDTSAMPDKRSVKYDAESIPGVIKIAHDLYVENPESLSALIDHLVEVGYDIKDLSKDEGKPSRDVLEKHNTSLWFATPSDSLVNIVAQCGTCTSYIPTEGVGAHGNECVECGDYTFLKYVEGGEITFSIPGERMSFKSPTFVIHSYDKEGERLNLYVNPADCKAKRKRSWKNFDLTPEESMGLVDGYVRDHPNTFSLEKIGGKKILSVYHKGGPFVHEDGINTHGVSGEKHNFTIKELSNAAGPFPDMISIHEAWHWAPMKAGSGLYKEIMNAAGQVARKDYYYQDGRPAFNSTQISWMLDFVDNFTDVDVDSVKPHLNTRMSGPGLIDTLANLTGHNTHIKTEPNIMNGVIFLEKAQRALAGDPTVTFTKEEGQVAAEVFQNPETGEQLRDILFPDES